MSGVFVRIGALAGFLGVALGAFGAHGLRGMLSADRLATFETGVRYHLIHAVAIVLVGVIREPRRPAMVSAAGWCFTAGIVCFSGSLYALAMTGSLAAALVTPFGGLFFLAGWLCLLVSV